MKKARTKIFPYIVVYPVFKLFNDKKFGYFGLKLLSITFFFLARQFGKLEMLAE